MPRTKLKTKEAKVDAPKVDDAEKATASNTPTSKRPKSSATVAAKSGKRHVEKNDAAKSVVWKTKFGPRRVRHDPPTLEEAIIAASGLTDDASEQAEIAASLMGLPVESVRAEVLKSAPDRTASTRVIASDRGGARRAVVVERRGARRPLRAG